MKSKPFIFGITAVLAFNLFAIDHSNLDENRPLKMEDPYTIAHGEWALELGSGYSFERQSSDRAIFPIEILYGAIPNLQLGLGSTLSTEPRTIEGQTRSGDLQWSALYNFNQETLSMPAFGLKTEFNFPTGVQSSGIDTELKGLITKTFGRLGVHLNAGYHFLSGTELNGRDGNYEIVLGASYPIGAPKYTRTVLLWDLFTEQSEQRGESNIYGTEVGFRHQLSHRTVLDFGVGSEFAGPAHRVQFYVTAGISLAF